jgi:uncharacterized protein YkwD
MSRHKLMPTNERAPKVAGKRLVLALFVALGTASVRPSTRAMAAGPDGDGPTHAALHPASATSPDIPFNDFDPQAEQQLLDLANQSRAQAGLPALSFDAGLTQAARTHAHAMLAARQLSHQFEGEPSLVQRIAAATRTTLDQEGENVALDFNAPSGHKHLMLSPPHRANLLNSGYNIAGMGVIRSGDRLYIVQDFGHALPTYSPAEAKDHIAAAVIQARHQARQPDLPRRDLPTADDAACSMAHADKLVTSSIHQLAQHYTVLTYTALQLENLPASATQVLARHDLRSFSVGACYARTDTYPTGVYWIVLSLE